MDIERDLEEKKWYHALLAAHHGSYHAMHALARSYPNSTWRERARYTDREIQSGLDPEKAWEKLRSRGIALLLKDDGDFPALLLEIPFPPFGIYVRGTLPPASRTTIAIVGTRKATEDGKQLARAFASELAASGFTIVSGLALGIDAASHEGCLTAKGITLAVLAQGLDRVYPRAHERLAQRILQNRGALISEYPPESETLPYRFLERNRIVSGLSRGTLIIEAPEASGALATARFALDQNRDVFVVPGPRRHPNFRGSHALIRSGAELVTETAHILAAFGIESEREQGSLTHEDTEEERRILTVLTDAGGPLDIDTLITRSRLETQVVSQTLTLLLLKKRVREHSHGYSL